MKQELNYGKSTLEIPIFSNLEVAKMLNEEKNKKTELHHEIHALEKKLKIYEMALKNIIRHQELVGGNISQLSMTKQLAEKALQEGKNV